MDLGNHEVAVTGTSKTRRLAIRKAQRKCWETLTRVIDKETGETVLLKPLYVRHDTVVPAPVYEHDRKCRRPASPWLCRKADRPATTVIHFDLEVVPKAA